MMRDGREEYLLVRACGQLCALPLEHVEETMRPQPVRALGEAPSFVCGVAVIRGAPVPVVDVASVLAHGRAGTKTSAAPDGEAEATTRFVTVRTGGRHVALAVDEVVDVRRIPSEALADLPPLIGHGRADAVEAIGMLDADLLVVLRASRLVPDAVWAAIGTGRGDPRARAGEDPDG
ncbi:MAG: chemotaxis protein CheW [Acidobacteria bacterium]|nr:chemotaxis protein CheW [Acidobacteriota bacterium]